MSEVRHFLGWALLPALALAAVLALPADGQEKAAAVEVKIDNFSFAPQTVTVAAGTTVTWVNHDDTPHNATSTTGVFKSKTLDTGDKFSFTFTKAGTFPYFCSLHPRMTGQVVVR